MLKALKRSFFAKTVCAALMLAVMSISVPKKSEAALVLVPIAIVTGGTGMIVGASIVSAGVVGFGATTIGFAANCRGIACFGILIAGAVTGLFLVLDDKADASTQSEAALSERYSFIEDRTVISQLAQAISEKAAITAVEENGTKRVSLSRAELTEILAPTDVMENHAVEFEAMVQELQ